MNLSAERQRGALGGKSELLRPLFTDEKMTVDNVDQRKL